MELNGELKSEEIAKKKKRVAIEPHLTVNQRLILDDVLEFIENVIPIDLMEVRSIISDSLIQWELDNHMRFSSLEKMPKKELKVEMDKVFTYSQQIAIKKLSGKVQDQAIIKNLNKVKKYYLKKHFPDMSTTRFIIYMTIIISSMVIAILLLLYASTRTDIFNFNFNPYFPRFP